MYRAGVFSHGRMRDKQKGVDSEIVLCDVCLSDACDLMMLSLPSSILGSHRREVYIQESEVRGTQGFLNRTDLYATTTSTTRMTDPIVSGAPR